MRFDAEGHLSITPRQLLGLAYADRRRLIDHYLIVGTHSVLPTYASYYDFLKSVSERIGVHPRNLVLRGSAQIGFSITPRVDKVWMEVWPNTDLDLAIVDAGYFERIDREVIRWEEHNRADRVKGRAARDFPSRQQDRFFNCCRVKNLPEHLFPDHFDAMKDIARMEHCGCYRALSAFIFRNWWALRSRYEFDLRQLTEGVPDPLPDPPERPLPRARQTGSATNPWATPNTTPEATRSGQAQATPAPGVLPDAPSNG